MADAVTCPHCNSGEIKTGGTDDMVVILPCSVCSKKVGIFRGKILDFAPEEFEALEHIASILGEGMMEGDDTDEHDSR